MSIWRWFRRNKQPNLGGYVGPATAYRNGRGAYAPDAAPAEQPDEQHAEHAPVNRVTWNAPTALLGRPLFTLGGERRANINRRGVR
jgi:hypothetical protein